MQRASEGASAVQHTPLLTPRSLTPFPSSVKAVRVVRQRQRQREHVSLSFSHSPLRLRRPRAPPPPRSRARRFTSSPRLALFASRPPRLGQTGLGFLYLSLTRAPLMTLISTYYICTGRSEFRFGAARYSSRHIDGGGEGATQERETTRRALLLLLSRCKPQPSCSALPVRSSLPPSLAVAGLPSERRGGGRFRNPKRIHTTQVSQRGLADTGFLYGAPNRFALSI